MTDLPDAAKVDVLRQHLETHYDVNVLEMQRLERGVFAVNLHDGRRWVTRVFSQRRPLANVAGDAAILQFLEQQGFPAERCAITSPVSVIAGWSLLVTDYIASTSAVANVPTLRAFGAMLGRLNQLPLEPGAALRPAGALHHYVPGGGSPAADLQAAAAWLAAVAERVPAVSRPYFDALQEQVAQADDCHDLPQALIHPDPVLKNLLVTPDKELVLIDWTGAGRGPRLAALALLLWTGALHNGSWLPRHVDAIVAGYRTHSDLEPDEVARLAAVMRLRPLVFACWRFRHAVLVERAPDGTEWWWPSDDLIQAIAARACTMFAQ